jgi:predicted transcriptional regulator YheO
MSERKKQSSFSVRERWNPLVDCIADLLGPRSEVVLHDLRHPERSIVVIRNGHVTGRKVGAPLTDLGFLMLRDAKKGKDTSGAYHSKTDTGKQLECNAVVLRDDQGEAVAILCINLDVTGTQAATIDGHEPPEHYHTSVAQVVGSLIEDASHRAQPGGRDLSAEEKMAIINCLNEQGVFLARGAVNQVSERLAIAPSTVYKYIQSVRSRHQGVRS